MAGKRSFDYNQIDRSKEENRGSALFNQRSKDCRRCGISVGDKIAVYSETMGVVDAKVIAIYKHHILTEYQAKMGRVRLSINYGALIRMGVI